MYKKKWFFISFGFSWALLSVFFLLNRNETAFSKEKKHPVHSPAHSVVFVSQLRGTIDPASSEYLKTVIQKASRFHAQAVLVELDTPGGLVSSVREMVQSIDRSQVPVIVYVTPAGAAATSAGAILMLASHVAVMAPGTNIGAAHPVGLRGKNSGTVMAEKAVEDVSAFARSLAQVRGRNVLLAEKIVRKSKSFTVNEALKGNIINLIAKDRKELFKKLEKISIPFQGKKFRFSWSHPIQFVSVPMTFGQKVLHYLANPNVAAILMTLAMLLIYVELSHPGITIAGVLGALCLVLAFMTLQILPIQTGGAVLVLLGMVLMILEPFLGTGGVLGGGGALSFVLGLLWLFDPAKSDLSISRSVWVPISLVLGFCVVVLGVVVTRMRKLANKTRFRIGGASMLGLSGYAGKVISIRDNGTRGKALFRGEVWDIDSQEGVLFVGDEVLAEHMVGFRVKVKKKTK